MLKKCFRIMLIAVFASTQVVVGAVSATDVPLDCTDNRPGDLIKFENGTAVYLYTAQDTIRPFAGESAFLTWYEDFSKVNVHLPDYCIDELRTGAPMLARPGTAPLKRPISNRVYANTSLGLVQIGSAEVAVALYGPNYETKIMDVPEYIWSNYTITGEVHNEKVPISDMFVTTADDPHVYLVEHGRLRQLADNHSVNPKWVNTVSKEVFNTLPVDGLKENGATLDPDEGAQVPEHEKVSYNVFHEKQILEESLEILPEQAVFDAMLREANKVNSMQYYGSVKLENLDYPIYETSDDAPKEGLGSAELTFDVKVDQTTCGEEKIEAHSSIDIDHLLFGGSISSEVELRAINTLDDNNQVVYFKVNELDVSPLDESEQAELEAITPILLDQWVRVDQNEIENDTFGIASLAMKLAPGPALAFATDEVTECKKKPILVDESLIENNFFVVTHEHRPVIVKGEKMRHFDFTIDPSRLEEYLYNTQDAYSESEYSGLGIEAIFEEFDNSVDVVRAQIWIGHDDSLPHKVVIEVQPYEEFSGDHLASITFEINFSRFNESFSITKPKDSKAFMDWIRELSNILYGGYGDEEPYTMEDEWVLPPDEDPDMLDDSFFPEDDDEWLDDEVYYHNPDGLEPTPIEVRPVSRARDHIRGNKDAKITIIEYSDMQCPFCRMYHPTMQRIIDEYDEVRWVYRHFPLTSIHPEARTLALASECASDEGKFWEFLDEVFEQQQTLTVDDAGLTELADAVGIKNTSKFLGCVSSEKYADRVLDDTNDAIGAGAAGTPYTIILNEDGEAMMPLHGSQSFESVEARIKDLL